MKAVILDANTLGDDISFEEIEKLCELTVYPNTKPGEITEHAYSADCVIINKVKLEKQYLEKLPNLKLICITATGYDNVDLSYCRSHKIAVCNVKGYSTDSVALITVAQALSLIKHIGIFDKYVKCGAYTKSGVQNRLTPVFHETAGKTWGIVGYGNIGKEVARIAKSLGFNVLYFKKTPDGSKECVELDELLQKSDVVSLHLPANEQTVGIISKQKLALMKSTAILINAARGSVTDEAAVADAVISGKIAGFASDVYTIEPLDSNHPFNSLYSYDNVILTPHMAWGAYEARKRLISEIALNIDSFEKGEKRNRVD